MHTKAATTIDDAAQSLRDALFFHARQAEMHAEYGIDDEGREEALDKHTNAVVHLGRALVEIVGVDEANDTMRAAERAASRAVHGA